MESCQSIFKVGMLTHAIGSMNTQEGCYAINMCHGHVSRMVTNLVLEMGSSHVSGSADRYNEVEQHNTQGV